MTRSQVILFCTVSAIALAVMLSSCGRSAVGQAVPSISPAKQEKSAASVNSDLDAQFALKAAVENGQVEAKIHELEAISTPSSSQLELAAALYLFNQDFRKAATIYDRLARLEPGQADYVAREAFCALLAGNNKVAVLLLKRAAEAVKDDPEKLSSVAMMFVNISHGSQAAELAERVLAMAPDDANALALTGHIRQGYANLEDAKRWYERAIQANSGHYFARYYLGQVLRDQGEFDKADRSFLDLARDYPNCGWPHVQRGYNFVLAGKPREALNCYQQACRVEPGDGLIFSEVGHMYVRLGQFEAAKQCYKKALLLKPTIRSASEMLVPVSEILGDEAGKVRALTNLATRTEKQRLASALAVVSLSLNRRGDLKQKYPDILPFPWVKELVAGETNSINNNFDEGEFLLKEALVKSQENVLARNVYANHLLRRKAYPEAASEFRLLSGSLPKNSTVLSGLALSLARCGKAKDAIKWARDSIAARPSARGYYSLGLALAGSGDNIGATKAFQEAARIRSYDPAMGLDLSNRLHAAGRVRDSQAVLKPLITADPQETDVWLDVVTNYAN